MTEGDSGRLTPNPLRLMAELEFLNELCRVVASNTELEPILEWIVNKTTRMLSADEGSIRLLESTDGQEQVVKTRYRAEQPGISLGSWPNRISQQVMGFLIHFDEPLATPDLAQDRRFPGLKNEETRLRSVLAVPLKVDNRFTGMLAVTQTTAGRQWKQDEVQLLSIVASSSAGVLEQARLRALEVKNKELVEREKLRERELTMAREIQMSLLPRASLKFASWEISGLVVPAREVGGDSFDFFPLGDGRVALAIADVSGKGVPAAIMMSNLQASLRAFCNGHRPIPEAIQYVNSSVARTAPSGKFITMFYGEFDSGRGVLRYCNAGHNYPMARRSDGSLIDLADGGLPLGIMDGAVYDEGEIALAEGDALLLYSDGISEALDAFGQEFGETRLRSVWGTRGAAPPAFVIDAVLAEVQAFRGHAVQSDDMTLVVLGAPGQD
jgi:serine phosphatase RsbU (regulator of sigma subunit)